MNEVLLRPVRAVVLGVATGLAAVAAMAPAANAAEPWGFEQVTPVNKGAGAVHPIDTFQTTADGNGFLLSATSSFDGVPAESIPLYTRYFASRGSDGWSNRAMDPPNGHAGTSIVMSVLLPSSDLSHVLVASTLALTPGATPDGGNLYVRSTATGEYTLVATHEDFKFADQFFANQGNFAAKYVANDGRSALFLSYVSLVPGAPHDPVSGQETGLYSWTAEEGVRLVSVLPESEGGAAVAALQSVGGQTDFGIRSPLPAEDGLDHVYFSSRVFHPIFGASIGPAYVHSNGETHAVSVSQVPEASTSPVPAYVLATGSGGRFMLFKTMGNTPLTSDTPTDIGGTFLYRYDAANDSLDYVGTLSGDASNGYTLQMSQDGRTIAFVSQFALAAGASTSGLNLYVWRDGALRFAAQGEAGGMLEGAYLRVLSENGRHLAFTENSTGPLSAAAISGANLGGPNAACPWFGAPSVCGQVFVYDIDADELECASCRADGSAPEGPAGDPGVTQPYAMHMGPRQVQTVANDGTAFFTTAEDLIASDANGLNDVYAYRDGEQRLLSRAAQGMKARFLDATPDGRSVFIATSDPIAPTDNDKAVDVYMTREGAGFPYTPPLVDPVCTGSDCRGPFTPVEGLPLAGSVSFTGRGNVGPSRAGLSVAGGRSIVGTAAKLRVKVPGRGRVTVSGAGVRTVKRSVSRAGTYTVRVALTAKARKALRRSKSTRKRVRVTFAPAEGSASKRTLSLTYKSKPTNKKKGR